ncbi:MAG: DUF1501 domain-containing protein [Pseudomonadota bacterium]
MTSTRRNFIKALGASTVAATAMSGAPSVFSAQAAETSGYKALVCVFLFGGLDNHDVILPYDQSNYDQFSQLRSSLIAQQSATRARNALLPLNPASSTVLQGRQVALPPEMPQLKALFDQRRLAIVGNVGPLIEPVTRARFESGAARLPPRLFSHNDQQATWQSSMPEGAQFGWGGLFADAVLASGANNGSAQFATIATEEVGPFLTGRNAVPYRVSPSGAARLDFLDDFYAEVADEQAEFLNAVRSQLSASSYRGNHILEQDMATAFSTGLATNTAYDQARSNGRALSTVFPAGSLSGQLCAVAETINVRSELNANRQIFFVGIGGFDTHSGQATSLPRLLSEIDGALASFNTAMDELGLSRDVTLFTASDFGRTLAVNGDGTDHGWGGHYFVLGGAVNGGELYGAVPPPAFGHDQDSGGGRLIPSIAVEQYAAELGRWFGLSSGELATALPNLGSFDALPQPFLSIGG